MPNIEDGHDHMDSGELRERKMPWRYKRERNRKIALVVSVLIMAVVVGVVIARCGV